MVCRHTAARLLIFFVLAGIQAHCVAGQTGGTEKESFTNVWNQQLAEETALAFRQLRAPAKHYAGISEADASRLLEADANYQKLMREKLEGRWFAALVTAEGPTPNSIATTFRTWRELVEFLAEKNAVVDVWAYGQAGEGEPRRIPAPELGELKRQTREQPTFITVTYPDETGKALSYRVEFGFQAAEKVWAAERDYQRHRALELTARGILAARNAKGLPDALAQWTQLQNEVHSQQFPLLELPGLPTDPNDIFVAFEFAVNDQSNFSKAVCIYRDSEIEKRVVGDIQVLYVRRAGQREGQEIVGFKTAGLGGQLEPATNAILGQDVVELRVKDPAQPDPSKWHVVEFGEPELLKQSALAHFAQLNAYLERKRKARAMQEANLALVAEPVIAALNIGGGIAGLGFPAGDAVRLAYSLITWGLISDVPTSKQMRELFALMAARERHPEIKLKPERFLNKGDIQRLKELGSKLSDQEVQTYLEQMSEEDVRAMLRLARMEMFDARITTFLNILTSTFKVSGVSDVAGPIRDIFNNVRFSMNGDINLSTLFLLAIGKKDMTALSGVPLRQLAQGEGPPEAWLQFFVVSVDIRAVINTVVRLTKPSLAKKELEKPFAYSPRMSELAAYEIRIFGFPLLMFYKRGLLKADRDAYEHDYAYGLLGVTVVERFPTREEMEAEIRAGRMFPLGLVKVPAPGGWKETDLVVYAHRIPGGKHRGKTTLVIYGLKAYAEYSDLIGRELMRFREFEQGLRAGAVIEQRLWTADSAPSASVSYEPVIHVGSNVVQQLFNPVLGNLLELRRQSLRVSWGLQAEEAEVERARKELASLGIMPSEPNPLVEIDSHNSSFIYRRQVHGETQLVKMVSIPGLKDIERELQKAQENKLIEEIRAETAAGKNPGVVLLNQAVAVQGRLELGALLRNAQGEVFGEGVTTGPKAIQDALELINRLPITDRARVRANHFAATAVQLEREGKGKEVVFLTIEFPLGEVAEELTNPLTGETERVVYTNGVWRQTITDRRIVEPEYDAVQAEIASRTYANLGTRIAPRRGVLLEETRTLDWWFRDLSQPGLDPYQPTIAKLRINYVTGQLTRETYGLFTLPIETVDDQYVTQNHYTQYGLFESATVFDNGSQAPEFVRPTLTKALEPILGRQRFQLVSQVPNNAALQSLSTAGYRTVLTQTDLVKGLVKTQTFDNANFGRKVQEEYLDPFEGTRSFAREVNWTYTDDFHFGLVPQRAVTLASPSHTQLFEVTTTGYDPVQRHLTGVELSYTGKRQTNTWDYRWSVPITSETSRRKTVQEFNREETLGQSTMTVRATGEVVHQASAEYDVATRTWRVTRQVWYRPGVPERVETNTYSAFGTLITTRVGNVLETRPSYTLDGMERASLTFGRGTGSAGFDTLARQQDDYRWQNGACNARVEIFLEGSLIDEYRITTDEDGRTMEDGIRTWPGLELKTVITRDGDSERVLGAEVLQNGQVRVSYESVGEVRRPQGDWILKVKGQPFWGLTFTNSYVLGDPLGHVVQTEFENGDRSRVTDWFPNSDVVQTSELLDLLGHAKERWVKRVNAGTALGLPYDLVTHYKLDPWGAAGFAEQKALLRGTDLTLFSERLDERTYFDLSKAYQCPKYAIDPSGDFGLPVDVAATVRSNVTALFDSQFRNWQDPGNSRRQPERVLEVTSIRLPGFFFIPYSTRAFDRAGNLLEEATGRMRILGTNTYSDEVLLAQMVQATINRRTIYRYQSGCFSADTSRGSERMAFSPQLRQGPGVWNVNDAGWREWPTEADIYRRENLARESGSAFYHSRRLHSPRWVKNNAYLPGITNVWMEWSSTELSDTGTTLFEAETIFDSEGEPSVYTAHTINSLGRPATKTVYQLPDPFEEDWQTISSPRQPGRVRVTLAGPLDLANCDFIGFYLDAPSDAAVSVWFTDSSDHSILVSNRSVVNRSKDIAFWPVGSAEVSWLPRPIVAQHGAVIGAPRPLVQQGKVFVVAIPELVRAGLASAEVRSVELEVAKPEPSAIRITRLYRLEPGERIPGPGTAPGFQYDRQLHSTGLATYRRAKSRLSSRELRTDRGWDSVVRYQDTAVASLHPRAEPPYYPELLLMDNSDPDAPEPLYSLAAEDGRFMDYLETFRTGDTALYTVVNGFDTPKLEVFRAGVLDDEISPGILALGYGYYVAVPLAKASGGVSSMLAVLHNRCVASAFALGADSLVRSVVGPRRPRVDLSLLSREHKPALAQAQDIEQLPTLAEALLPRRQTPWPQTDLSGPAPATPSSQTNVLREFSRLSELYLKTTKLIPTSPGTSVARYVDTVQEAAIIELAVRLRETRLAADLLSFYWGKLEGGTYPLRAFYDAETGASLTKRTEYKRPSDSAETASAQLAMAEAAFCLGATGDTNALKFGTNLIGLLLRDFRPDANDLPAPRGITETRVEWVPRLLGIKRWPQAKTFSVASNSRAYLLLRRVAEQSDHFGFAPEWKQAVLEAAQEQEAWLTNRILPYVQTTGTVPKGMFEIQDVHEDKTALALDRWTATEDWLRFIEAADRLGVSREITRTWLDNLARAHGVVVNGIWGLDWGIALQRPDAISTALTSKFRRIANLLNHRPAAEFASRSLNQLQRGPNWPAVATTAPADLPLKTGQGPTIYPAAPVSTGHGTNQVANSWPETMGVYADLDNTDWQTNSPAGSAMTPPDTSPRDITRFLWLAAGFYLAIIAAALFWWALSLARRRRRTKTMAGIPSGLLVPEPVMRKAEERWANLVLGLRMPSGAESSRYSNAAVEQNFHIQLRAIYKLVLEWRRVVNGWAENDARLGEVTNDPWLNGMDEFAVIVGLYSRWVVKVGRKDGLPRADVLQENEDSNHIWSRLVMYFSESHQRLLGLMKDFKANPAAAAVLGLNEQIELVLRMMGARERRTALDARTAFDAPANRSAMDLLLIQLPGVTLTRIAAEMESKLDIPREQFANFISLYKTFKAREQLSPVHPYVLEAAKMLPHFLLMGLVALIWYNNHLRGLKIFVYLNKAAANMATDWHSLIWAVPLFVGFALSVTARAMQIYRYRWRTHAGAASFALDKEVSSFFERATKTATPVMRLGSWWNPVVYQRAGWIFRALGLALLAISLFSLEPPSFATFMFVKAVLGGVLVLESACLLGPLLLSRLSSWLEDYVSARPNAWQIVRWLNQLNLVPTRPASLIWLSIKYHFQPSVPTGGVVPMIQAVAFYVGFVAVFFAVGSYMFAQALEIWFQGTYHSGRDVSLVVGGFLFWNTMYLLRFGLFILIAAIASAAAIYPFRVAGALAAVCCFGAQLVSEAFNRYLNQHLLTAGLVLIGALVIMAFESELLAWLKRPRPWRRRGTGHQDRQLAALERFRRDPDQALGVVYMSGDDLSFHKLTSELLIARLKVLREQLGSRGIRLLSRVQELPDDALLTSRFAALYDLERTLDVTLWHPIQLVVAGEQPHLRAELGLNLLVESARQREEILRAWHLRRWLVTMMSTAGHSQDTAINLADIALALDHEGLGTKTVFYLIQNKYDNNENNRPAQASYQAGELGQRNKLARLLMELAPGCRAYSLNDWTPFGFKAGGLVGMDLVHEESLKLTNMLLMDRNANVHDLEALMADLKLALSDPGVVIVLPGRSTTNTLTAIGQSSQLVEEGQRALSRGVMMLGGMGGETLGTGWGNIQAVYYGRVQRALCDFNTPKMPLTTPSERSASFGERWEGLVGFGPHAVGISEDIWGITQAAHNALGLGYAVKFRRSAALWHKMRETWSHAEWLAAFPRWSGGYLQMMLDPLMQRVNDYGPFSVFAKEIRANGGRFFLGAPAALLSILLMPLAIIADVSPFVQILILLWNLGLMMNQVLTALGSLAYLEATGFNKITALAGLIGAGIVAGTNKTLAPFGLPLLVIGFLAGGFALGLGRWLYCRGRDLVVFGPQLVIHTLGQMIRQSLEFVLSGAAANDAKAVNMVFRASVGPREDRPFEQYQNLVNLRTVVWGVGLSAFLLDLFALANLDFLNVLLLLPSLMFSVSTLAGPFLMQPKPGKDLGSRVWVPKLAGWLASFWFYLLVARWISLGGWWERLAIVLFIVVFGRLALATLKYAGYSKQLSRMTNQLARQIAESGLAPIEADKLATHIVRGLSTDVEKTSAALEESGLVAEARASILTTVRDRVLPLLKQPLRDLEQKPKGNPRFRCEWTRSFVIGLFTFIWFFVVPMPGLLVFTAPGGSRISLSPSRALQVALTVIGVILVGGLVSLLLDWWERYRLDGTGLAGRIQAQYRSFQSLTAGLTPVQSSSLYAMFTDVQTYFDQRSYAYARRTLRRIEETLRTATQPK